LFSELKLNSATMPSNALLIAMRSVATITIGVKLLRKRLGLGSWALRGLRSRGGTQLCFTEAAGSPAKSFVGSWRETDKEGGGGRLEGMRDES
jgi:hypothetical protein